MNVNDYRADLKTCPYCDAKPRQPKEPEEVANKIIVFHNYGCFYYSVNRYTLIIDEEAWNRRIGR